jgi:AcrR family transcriptional regulator
MKNIQLRQSRRTQYTKMIIRESLMNLMKTRTISDISVKEICAAADISRSTFYAHYKDQYDLLEKTEGEILEKTNAILNKYNYKNTKSEACQMLEEILHYIICNKSSIYVLFSENGDINFQKSLFSSIYKTNIFKIFTGEMPDEKTREYYFMFVAIGSIGLIYHWIKTNINKPVDELARLILHITEKIGR